MKELEFLLDRDATPSFYTSNSPSCALHSANESSGTERAMMENQVPCVHARLILSRVPHV